MARWMTAFLNCATRSSNCPGVIGPGTSVASNSVENCGSAFLSAVAVFVLRGIQAPLGHAMPHTQNS